MRSQSAWLEHAAALTAAQANIHQCLSSMSSTFHRTGALRDNSDDPGVVAWRKSTERYHAEWPRMYPLWFWESVDRLRDATATDADIDCAVTFLEADPVADRSGYIKADVCKWLLRVELNEFFRHRLTTVVLAQIYNGYRREFRHYCKLARVIDNNALREAVNLAINGSNADVARRAKWMRDTIARAD